MGDKIKVLKLISGEDIIGEVEIEGTEVISIYKPLRIVISQQGLGLMPWAMVAKTETFVINQDHITTVYTPATEVANGYRQQITGIVTAPASALQGLDNGQG